MKLKYIFASIVAALALAVSCSKEADQHYLSEIQVSTSYVSLATTGETNTAQITVTSQDSWTITLDEKVAKWLTVTPTSGNAGATTVTFSAAAGEGNTAEVAIVSGAKKQFVNVIQGLASVTELPIDEVLKSPQGKTYRVSGAISGWYSNAEQYGNMYITDETGTILIYGMADKDGKLKNYPIKSWGLEIGDVITVEGPLGSYNGTPQLVDVTLTKLVKSLIKIETVEPEDATIAKEGGDVTVLVSNKGNKLGVIIPEEAQSWLGISLLAGDVVVFTAAPNEGGDREAIVTFTTTDGKKDYTAELTIIQKGAIKDITAVEFNALADGPALYRIKGVVTEIVMDKADPTKYNKYGNFYVQDGTGIVYVYGLLPEAGGATAQDVLTTKGVKVGDVITVVGPKGSYKDAPQMVNAYYVEHTSVTATTAEAFNALADGSDLYMVSGKITDIVMDKADPTKYNKYGNFYVEDETGTVYVYGLVPTTGQSGTDMLTTLGVKKGDSITVVGPKGSYKGAAQMLNAYYVSHKEGTGDDSGDEIVVASPYVLSVTAGENNSYAGDCDITIGNLVWNLTGNSTTDPWRIGGKSITDTERPLYNKTPISFDVAKIEVEHGTVNDITVNSFTLIVSTNADFSSPVSTLTGTVTANETTTFNRPEGVKWEKCYFKFVYNVTVSASSNKYVQFKKATFTE